MDLDHYGLPPDFIDADELATLSPELQNCYRPAPLGGYALASEIVEVRAAKAAELAAMKARTERLERQFVEVSILRALGQALRGVGVRVEYRRAVEAMLASKMKFEVRPDGVVDVISAFGPTTVESAVQAWAETDEAKAFLPPPPRVPGPLAEAMRSLH